jgi:hypothetical protein
MEGAGEHPELQLGDNVRDRPCCGADSYEASMLCPAKKSTQSQEPGPFDGGWAMGGPRWYRANVFKGVS